MKVALYCRISTDKQELDNQLNALRAFCDKSGYQVYQEYSDIISGKELSRPAYDLMFQDAHKKLFDLVLFWDMSRFSRAGTLHTLQKLHELELLGIGYKSYQEQYLSSVGEFKDVVISIFATVAKIERQKISERTKAGLIGVLNVGKRGKDKRKRSRKGYFN
jgi:DNA invertase Pin-like site-specific DNA recombinase